MAAKTKEPKLQVKRVADPKADYVKLSGIMDKTFTAEVLGPIKRPTAIDLGELQSITSQGVQNWCELVRLMPTTVPLYLVNVSPCFTAQVEYVPNFTGHAEIVNVIATSKCTGCNREQRSVFDMLSYTSGSQMLERCDKCGAVTVALELNLSRIAPRRARKLAPEVADLLSKLGVYRRASTAQGPFQLQKLIEGNANLLRMSGAFDEKFRWQRLLDGLEGTMLLDATELHVSPGQLGRFVGVLKQAAAVCAPIVLVGLPSTTLEEVASAKELQKTVTIHSVVAPCYCSSCDDIRQLAIEGQVLLSTEPTGTCPRCGRSSPVVSGMVSLDKARPLLAPLPGGIESLIGRLDELFSAAEVEAKLTTPGPVEAQAGVPQRIGPYRILRSIARGGMADVFLANRDDFSKPMALKLLRREVLSSARISLAMFLREARLNARLNHPNIVQVFDVNESEGNLYIVMEYLDGHALWRVLGQWAGPFPVPIALRIIGQVLRALAHAHAARDAEGKPLSIVHRDVSPSNVIICTDGNVKLIDFGIALAGSTPDVMAGNPAWMSPEQFAGTALDGRSDLFSVATVLHELLTGQQLFTGAKVHEIGINVLQAPIPRPKVISDSLCKVMERAHQRDASKRFQSASEFADALLAVAKDNGGEASEHDVRVFLAEVLAGKKSPIPAGASELALCETPLSEPVNVHPTAPTERRAAVKAEDYTEAAPDKAASADSPTGSKDPSRPKSAAPATSAGGSSSEDARRAWGETTNSRTRLPTPAPAPSLPDPRSGGMSTLTVLVMIGLAVAALAILLLVVTSDRPQ